MRGNTIPKFTPDDAKAARAATGLSSERAGALVYISGRMWRKYEAGDAPINPGLFELFLIKTGQK